MMDWSWWFYRFDQADPDFTRVYNVNERTVACACCQRPTQWSTRAAHAVEDVAYCENTQEQRVVHAQLYQHLSGQRRAGASHRAGPSLACGHDLAPTVSSSPALRSISTARDHLYFDLCCTTNDAEGRKVFVNYRKSYDLRSDQLVWF